MNRRNMRIRDLFAQVDADPTVADKNVWTPCISPPYRAARSSATGR